MPRQKNIDWRIVQPLIVLSTVSLSFLLFRIIVAGSFRYWFLLWNLALAWVPIILILILVKLLKTYRWSSWKPALLTIVALLFLPNSFYLITDYIHLHSSGEISLLFDVVLFGLFTITGFLLGFLSLYILHEQFIYRFNKTIAERVIVAIIATSSFAIYLGRHLRWNSWDVFVNPLGIIYDIMNRLVSPSEYSLTFSTTAIFFVLITSFYFCTRWLIRLIAANFSHK